jgi:hypothetical protein
MRRLSYATALALALSLGLAACVAPSHGNVPQSVAGQVDTYRFRIYPYAVVFNETVADRVAEEEISKFRLARGYASSQVLSRDALDPGFLYTVRFAR